MCPGPSTSDHGCDSVKRATHGWSIAHVYRLHLLLFHSSVFKKDSFVWDQGAKYPEEMQHTDIYIPQLSIPKDLDTFFCANLKTLLFNLFDLFDLFHPVSSRLRLGSLGVLPVLRPPGWTMRHRHEVCNGLPAAPRKETRNATRSHPVFSSVLICSYFFLFPSWDFTQKEKVWC